MSTRSLSWRSAATLLGLGIGFAACGSKSGLILPFERPAEPPPTPDAGTVEPPEEDAAPAPEAAVDVAPDPIAMPEVCNGVDDDLDGNVDDGFTWVKDETFQPVRVSTDASELASPSGIASDRRNYAAFYEGGDHSSSRVFATPLASDGKSLRAETPLTQIVAHSHGGTVHARAIAWGTDRYGLAWIDLRDGTRGEIYFALLGADSTKVAPGDVRISRQGGFGFNPSIDWSGSRFIVVWEDLARSSTPSPLPGQDTRHVFAQAVDRDATLVGQAVDVSQGITGDHENPFVVASDDRTAVVYRTAVDGQVRLSVLDDELARSRANVPLTPAGGQGDYPRAARLGNGWVAAWHGVAPSSRTIWAVRVSASGERIGEAQPVIDTPGHARYPFLVGLGDRVLMVYSDDRDGLQGYELYFTLLDSTLAQVTPPVRITEGAGDTIFPAATFGPNGDIGILFRDEPLDWGRVMFTRLVCALR
jgi:hypothetical protein